MIEAKKLAYANIIEDLGDPRFKQVPVVALIAKSLAETRRSRSIPNTPIAASFQPKYRQLPIVSARI